MTIQSKNHTKTDKNAVYLYLAALNLISGAAIFPINFTLLSVVGVILIALFVAWLEAGVYGLLCASGSLGRKVAVTLAVAVAVVMNIFIIVDYFLLFRFSTVFNLQSLDLILGTNPAEAREFFGSYAPWWAIACGILIAGAANIGLWKLSWLSARKLGGNRIFVWSKRICAGGGAAVLTYMVVMFAIYRHGAQIPTFSAPTRLGYAILQRSQNTRLLKHLRDLSVATLSEKDAEQSATPAFDVVWVLGESFSRSHSPLYGYDKNTNPRLSALAEDSSLVVMTDVVTHEDWTQKVLKSLLSTGRGNDSFGKEPLFPVIMRKAGWHISLYDNEFFVKPGSTFFYEDAELSDMMFDSRNTKTTKYDGELVKTATLRDTPAMYIFHLMGQHFTYADRYTPEYRRFKADDYDAKRFNPRQREILAHYDNATLYNDAVVADIIDRFSNRDCIVIYFPDHGEEIYDCRDYFGHGNAISASDIAYQIQIPMFIWFSDTFRAGHPDIVSCVNAARNLPVTTDDFSHFMLDLTGVRTKHFDPSRSFINSAYDATAPRYVLHSVDFNTTRSAK